MSIGEGNEGEVPREPEKDQNGRFADVIVLGSEGGNSRGATKWRIYELPNFRVAMMHAPGGPSFSAYFQSREGLQTSLFHLNKRDPDETKHKITKIIQVSRGDLEHELDLRLSQEALQALPREDDPPLRQEEGVPIENGPESDTKMPIDEEEKSRVQAGEAYDNFFTAKKLGLPDVDPYQAKSVIKALQAIIGAETMRRGRKRRAHRQIEERIAGFHVFAD